MLIPRRVNHWLFITVCYLGNSCTAMHANTFGHMDDRQLQENDDHAPIKTDFVENISVSSVARVPVAVKIERTVREELSALGVGKLEVMDLGVYGKIGPNSIFVAERTAIPNYDRLYWVMVRILSEKYGCFIRRKVDRGHSVSFQCRDQRTVTMARKMSGRFAMLHVQQFDRSGRGIDTRGARLSNAQRWQLSAKRRERDLHRSP
jgi:hypothetical protein